MTTRHLFASLLFVTGCSILAPSGRGSSPETPAAPASDPDAARVYPHGDAEKACTIEGNLDARCMEVAGYPSSTAPAQHRILGNQQMIMACFEEIAAISRKEQDPLTTARIDALYEQYVGSEHPKLAADPGTAACMAATDSYMGHKYLYNAYWSHEGANQERAVVAGFANVCKLEPRSVHFPTLTIVDVAQSKIQADTRVAFSSSKPEFEYLCSGMLRWKDNGNLIVTNAYFTTTKELKKACVDTCRSTSKTSGDDKLRWVCDDTPNAKSCIAACTKKCEDSY